MSKIKLLILVYCSAMITTYGQEQAYHMYFWALYNQLEQHHDKAAPVYQQLLQKSQPLSVYESFAQHLLQTSNHQQLTQVLEVLTQAPAKKVETEILCIHILEALGNRTAVEQKVTELHGKYPHHPELTYYAATIEVQHKQYQKALAILDSYLQNASSPQQTFLMHFLKAHIFCALNDIQKALHYVQKCTEAHPHFEQAWLLSGMLYESVGNIDQAIQGYKTCLSLIGNNNFIEHQLHHLYNKQQILHKSAQALFNQALQLFSHNNYQAALQKVQESLSICTPVPARLLKLEILCKLHQEQEAIDLMQQWLLDSPDQHIWYQTLHIFLGLSIPADTLLRVLHAVEKQHPTIIYPLLYQADIYLRLCNTQKAFHYLHKALPYTQDAFMRTHILFQLGLLYYQEQKYELMYQCLQEARLLGLNFPPLLNLLAYYYTTIMPDLEQAQKLVSLALKNDAHNPHFLDTQALIWYKQKKYQESYNLLTELLNEIDNDPTIYYHCAQSAYKMGNKEHATQLIHQAIVLTKNEYDKKRFERRLTSWR